MGKSILHLSVQFTFYELMFFSLYCSVLFMFCPHVQFTFMPGTDDDDGGGGGRGGGDDDEGDISEH